MTSDPRTIAVYDAKAADYADLVQTDQPDRHLRDFMALIPAAGRVLDLGCGPGRASYFMAQAGLKPDPLDASTSMVELAQTSYNLPARLGTFHDITGENIYAGVWANFSLLHAQRADLPVHLDAIFQALIPGGTLHIGMKTGTGQSRDGIDRRYTYVTEAELETLLNHAGFRVSFRDTGLDKGLSGEIAPWVILRAEK